MQSSSCFLFRVCWHLCLPASTEPPLYWIWIRFGHQEGLLHLLHPCSVTGYWRLRGWPQFNCIPIELLNFNFPLQYLFCRSVCIYIYIMHIMHIYMHNAHTHTHTYTYIYAYIYVYIALYKMCFIRSWWKKALNPDMMTATPRLNLTLKVETPGLSRWICLCPVIKLSLECGLLIISYSLYKSISCPV